MSPRQSSSDRDHNRPQNTHQQEALVQYIAENLVDKPSEVRLSRRTDRSSVVLELHVASEDTGRVIGKNGRVAESIRTLIRASKGQDTHKIVLKIL